jgi:cytochrome P450
VTARLARWWTAARARVARRLARALGRRLRRRISATGIDLSNIPFLPGAARVPLQRSGTDPVPALARLRETDPVHVLDLPFDFRVHLVTGYEAARAVLADATSYSNDIRHLFAASDAASAEDVGGLGFTDPPEHTRLRRVLTPEFTVRRLQRLQPRIEEVVAERLDAFAAAGRPADLVREVAVPVPFDTICELLGLAYADRDAVARLSSRRFDASGGGASAFGAVSRQRELLLDAVTRQRREPGPGLIGRIIRDQGEQISDRDLAGLADGVFTGGHETTAGMIALGTLVLLRDPASAEAVRDGTAADVDRVVEELLRYLSVVQVSFPRFARRDMTLLGHRVRAGEVVIASLSGADRDPAWAGPDPDRFDPLRVPASGHLAFGHGAHRCIGAELARMELRTVLPALFRRFPRLALAVPEERLRFRELSFVHGIEELCLTW